METLDAAAGGSYEVQRTVLETLYGVPLHGTPMHVRGDYTAEGTALHALRNNTEPLQRFVDMLPADTLSLTPFVMHVNGSHIRALEKDTAAFESDTISRVRASRDSASACWHARPEAEDRSNRSRVRSIVQACEKSKTDARAAERILAEHTRGRDAMYEQLLVLVQASAYRTGRASEQARQLNRSAVYMAMMTGNTRSAVNDMLSEGDVPLLVLMQLKHVDLDTEEQARVANIFAALPCTGNVQHDLLQFRESVRAQMGSRVVHTLERVGLL